MNFGAWNHSLESRPMELNPLAKDRLRKAIDQQVAEFLASGGQIRRFELISRDINGKPFNPINTATLPGKKKKG